MKVALANVTVTLVKMADNVTNSAMTRGTTVSAQRNGQETNVKQGLNNAL